MQISLECPFCKNTGTYSLQTIIGEYTDVYKIQNGLFSDIPDPVIVKCQFCPKSFKVAPKNLEENASRWW